VKLPANAVPAPIASSAAAAKIIVFMVILQFRISCLSVRPGRLLGFRRRPEDRWERCDIPRVAAD
jgi:hypothetical protein